MVKKSQVPGALMFSGVRGSGKTTMGRILAAAMNCEQWPDGPCDDCPSCKAVWNLSSLDVLEIDAASNGLVADIRQLREQVMYAVGGDWRIVLLDEAHSMSREGFNALLKTLEEPPPRTVFVLLTTEPNRIIETVVSRCMTFEFRRIPPAEIQERLRYICEVEGIQVDTALLALLADRADGGLRNAVMALDQCHRAEITSVSAYADLLGEADYAPVLVAAMLDADTSKVFAVEAEVLSRMGDVGIVSAQLVSLFRDLLILHAGGELAVQGQALAHREALTRRIPAEKCVAACRILWDLRTKVRMVDQRSTLDLALVMVQESLKVQPKKMTNGNATDQRKPMSLADMRAMTRR